MLKIMVDIRVALTLCMMALVLCASCGAGAAGGTDEALQDDAAASAADVDLIGEPYSYAP